MVSLMRIKKSFLFHLRHRHPPAKTSRNEQVFFGFRPLEARPFASNKKQKTESSA